MKRWVLTLILSISLLLSACGLPMRYTDVRGSGQLTTEMRPVSGINSVELSGMGTLVVEQGDEEKLEITAEDNLIDYLRSSMNGTNLSLGIDEFVNLHPTKDIVYHLTVKDLATIETSGKGNVKIESLNTDRIRVEISGDGSVKIGELQADSLDVEISGMGDIELSGSVVDQDVKISGAGDYQGGGLYSREADIQISGKGNALIWVAEELNLDLSGMGNLEYFGEPILNLDISGMGKVESLGNK
jgi:hypothetical protein